MNISDPSYSAWFTAWMEEQHRKEESAITELMYSPQPPMPPATDEVAYANHNKRLAFRHQFLATVNLYYYVREFYEKHLPKQFARRVALPSYFTSPSVSLTQLNSTVLNAQQPNAKRTARVKQLADWSVLLTGLDEEVLRAVASEMGLFGDEVIPARAWSGLVLELKERHYLPDDANTEALVKAFATWGITVTPNSIRTPAKTAIAWKRKADKAFKTVLKQQTL